MKKYIYVLIALLLTQAAYSQRFHAYSAYAGTCIITDDGKLTFPLISPDDKTCQAIDVQFKFYTNGRFDFVANSEVTHLTYEKIDDVAFLVKHDDPNGELWIYSYTENPHISGEYILKVHRSLSIDKLKGTDLILYYCQLLK